MTHLPGCADGRVYLGDGVYVYCPCAYARPRAESEFAIVARVVREHFAGEK